MADMLFEHMAVSDISKDIIHMRSLLRSMGFAQLEATTVHEDNTACIEWGNNIIGGRERAKQLTFASTSPMRPSRMDT